MPGAETTRFNTAVALVLLALGIRVAASGEGRRRRPLIVGVFIVVLAMVGPAAAAYALNLDLGVVLGDRLGAALLMAPQTAVCLLLLATALLVTFHGGITPSRFARWSAHTTIAVALFSLFGYLFHVGEFYRVRTYTAVALPTSIALLLLGLAILLVRIESSWIRLLFVDTVAGRLTRRLMPVVIVVPLAAGKLFLLATEFGDVAAPVGVAALTVGIIAVFWVIVIANAELIERTDAARRDAEREIRESEEAALSVMDASADLILTIDEDSIIQSSNHASMAILGYAPGELAGRPITDIMPPDLRERHRAALQRYIETGERTLNWAAVRLPALHKDGRTLPLEISMGEGSRRGKRFFVGFARDVSERDRTEQRLRNSEERYRSLFESSPQPMWVFDRETLRFLAVNEAAVQRYGYTAEEFMTMTIADIRPQSEVPRLSEEISRVRRGERTGVSEWQHITRAGDLVDVEISAHDFLFEGRPARLVLATDVTARNRALAALRAAEEQLNLALAAGEIGTWDFDVAAGRLAWPARTAHMLGSHAGGLSHDEFLALVHPDDRVRVANGIRNALDPRDSAQYEDEFRIMTATEMRWISARGRPVFDGEHGDRAPVRMIGTMIDVTQRRNAEETLRAKTAELERSNADLQQFAYVASHDLQEPLRMVTGYVQLIARRYRGRLDRDADEFIEFAVDGVNRMQHLIRDLLAFSRVSARPATFERIDCNEVIEEALGNLQLLIEENNARVTVDPLPAVRGDRTQIIQLFQNLIGNAVKFRAARAPEIHVSGTAEGSEAVISVRDNGIGIEPAYRDRIFAVFQRLHSPGTYPGTGIGLAICKRIADRHGGRVWVESVPDEGSVFHVMLPAIAKEDSHARDRRSATHSNPAR